MSCRKNTRTTCCCYRSGAGKLHVARAMSALDICSSVAENSRICTHEPSYCAGRWVNDFSVLSCSYMSSWPRHGLIKWCGRCGLALPSHQSRKLELEFELSFVIKLEPIWLGNCHRYGIARPGTAVATVAGAELPLPSESKCLIPIARHQTLHATWRVNRSSLRKLDIESGEGP